MGDPRRLTNKYETPRKVWDAQRIEEESALVKEYGLKNMRELWVISKELKRIRREARKMLSLGEEGQKKAEPIITKVKKLGYLSGNITLDSLLSLDIKSLLERRLQTQVVRRGLARTFKQSRQLVTHGFVMVNGRKVNVPSYIVPISEESTLSYYKAIDIGTAPVGGVEKPGREEHGRFDRRGGRGGHGGRSGRGSFRRPPQRSAPAPAAPAAPAEKSE